MCLWPRLKLSKRRSKISGSRSWYEMKDLAKGNRHVKYESPTTYQAIVMTKIKVFEKKAKLQGQRVKVMVSNERSCQKEYTCEI
jgi:hypothetical protein